MLRQLSRVAAAPSGAARVSGARRVSTAVALPPFAHKPAPYAGPTAEEVLEKRKKFMHPSIFHYYKKPLMVVEGKMQYVWDERGRRYLDCFGGIVTVSVGHCHPEVVKACEDQSRLLQHATTIYLHPEVALYAEELAERMPKGLDCVYFVNSGSEANDLAMLMARLHTAAFDVIALRNCYHGASPGTMGLTAHGTWRFPTPVGFGVHHAANPHPYRGPWAGHPDAAARYADDLRDLIRSSTPGRVAAFFHETIQGVGGAVELEEGYLKRAYEVVRQAGGLCIADEVQTGFGRTGSAYWGFENHGVTPDIVTLAKGIGNGFPLAAVVTRREIAEAMSSHIHFNTFGGNPVAAAVGRAVLRAIDDDATQFNCRVVGGHLQQKLRALAAKHAVVGDVRGRGLMIGVELVKDRASKEPAKAETAAVLEAAREAGLLLGKGGLDGNVLRIKPPMCMTRPDADFVADVLDRALAAL